MAYDVLVEIALDSETLRYSGKGVSTSTGYYEERVRSVGGLVRELSETGKATPIQNCSIVLDDVDGTIRKKAAGTTLNRRTVTVKTVDLSSGAETTVFVGKIKSRATNYDSVSLDVRDDSYDKLQSPIGITTSANIFTNLASTTKLMFVPIVLGTVSSTTYDSKGHIPAYLIDPAVGQTKYRYVAAQHPLKSITAVYRNGVLVSASDYTVSYVNVTVDGDTVRMTMIDFNHDKRKSNPDTEDVQITYDATGLTNDNLESGTLLTNPADILKALLKLRGVLADGDFDSTLFTACQSAYTTAGLTVRGAIVDNITWLDVIDKFAESFNLQFFKTRSGTFGMVFDNAASGTAVEDFKDSVNIISGSFSQQIQEKDEEASSYEFSYASDFARGGYSSLFAYTDSTEATALGDDVRKSISYELVPDINQCQTVSQIKLFQGRSSRIRVNFQCLPYPDLELGDYITVTHYSGESTDGLGFDSKSFRIRALELSYDGSELTQTIEALDHPGISLGSPADTEPPREAVTPSPPPNSIDSNVVWTLTDYNTVSWNSCTVYVYQDGAAGTFSITGSNTGNMAAITYIYLDLDVSLTAFQVTTTYATAIGPRKYHLATAMQARRSSAKAHLRAKVGTVNTGSYTVPGSIGPDEIPNNTIEADHILANTITASKLNVTELSAITADIGDITSGTITGVTITGGTIQTAASGARVELTSANGLRVYDSTPVLRVQIPTTFDQISFFDTAGSSAGSLQGTVSGVTIMRLTTPNYLNIYDGSSSYTLLISPTGYIGFGGALATGSIDIESGINSGTIDLTAKNDITLTSLVGNIILDTGDKVGVGTFTTGPDAKLDVLSTSAQLRLTYTDGSVYTQFTTNSSGYLNIDPSGNRVGIDNSSPAGKLDILATGDHLLLTYTASTALANLSVNSSGTLNITTSSNDIGLPGSVRISDSATEYMDIVVASSGNVSFQHTGTYFTFLDPSGNDLAQFYYASSGEEAEVLKLGNSTYRGGIILSRKTSGTDKPGVVALCPADSDSPLYLWCSNENDLKVSTDLPAPGTGGTDGYRLGPNVLQLVDSVSAPSTASGRASIYILTGNVIQIKFGDGTIKNFTLATP